MSDYVQLNSSSSEFNGSDSWVILSPIELSIKKKIESVGTPLKDWDINIYRGVLTGCNEAFIIPGKKRQEILDNCLTAEERKRTDELIRPILRGRDIKRYSAEFADLWLINAHNGIKCRFPRIDINDYPAAKAHLDQYWKQIEKRADQGDTPYNLRNCAYMEDFSEPKIVYQELTQGSAFFFDKEANYTVSNTGYIATGKDIKYLFALLNTKFIEFCFRSFYSISMGATGVRWLSQYVSNLPIAELSIERQQPFIQIVDKIFEKRTKNPTEDISTEEFKINSLVYELYGLTQEEINIIESK